MGRKQVAGKEKMSVRIAATLVHAKMAFWHAQRRNAPKNHWDKLAHQQQRQDILLYSCLPSAFSLHTPQELRRVSMLQMRTSLSFNSFCGVPQVDAMFTLQ